MKKILSIALLLVMVISVLVVASNAAGTETSTYWEISPECLVKSKVLDDGRVPTFKKITTNDGDAYLLVGLPTGATIGQELFRVIDNQYTLGYVNKKDQPIEDFGSHIGTTDKLVVYKDGAKVVEYGLVTYGDANGDGVFDVLDSSVAALCVNNFMSVEDSAAIYEAMKVVSVDDNVVADDYQQVVNDSVTDKDDLVENIKGRKKPINQTLNFDSVIYAYDGAAKAAAVTAEDSQFTEIARVCYKYNGNEEIPSASGIYSVTATVSDSEEYLVTPGTRELGFIVIAPKSGTAYKTIVDDTNKKIIIDINKPNDQGVDLTGYLNGWINPNYALTVGTKNVEDSTGLATGLDLRSFDLYKTNGDFLTITAKTITDMKDTSQAALGCYLADDLTLWNDNFAERTVPVKVGDGDSSFSYSISFRQNEETINRHIDDLFIGRTAAARGQRSADPYSGSRPFASTFALEGKRKILSETNSYENCIRVVVRKGYMDLGMAAAVPGTGLKTIFLGGSEGISFVTAKTKAALPKITADNAQILYDPNRNNVRYTSIDSDNVSDYNETELLNLANKVLGGFDMKVSTTTPVGDLPGQSGWCRYACADDSTGLRYIADYFIEFVLPTAEQDSHKKITITAVEGCTIAVAVSNMDRMTQYEPFKVNATLPEGYKLSVKEAASGKEVYYEAEHGWYIMPSADVIVTAVKS